MVEIVEGDLLAQQVEAIVNAWNRNTIPWWLLLPQGVSGAIKRRAGTAPFRELARHGRLDLGEAVATGAGRLPFRTIIHVAGINDFWRSSAESIRKSTLNALRLAEDLGVESLAFPIIGAGSGGMGAEAAEKIMVEALDSHASSLRVVIVRYRQSEPDVVQRRTS